MTAKVSVVIPVYNVENYLRKCLDSLVNQTYKNLELICVNDGSTDGSLEILKEYANKDSRFIIINQENKGLAVARSNGIDVASGDYLSHVDSDDWVDVNYYERVVKVFAETNCDVVQLDYTNAYSNHKYVIEHFDRYLKKRCCFNIDNMQKYSINDFKNLKHFPVKHAVWDKVYNLKFIKKNNIRSGFKNYGEDGVSSIKCIILASKVVYLKKSYYYYNVRQSSEVHNKNYLKLTELKTNINLVKNFIEGLKCNRFDKCLNNYICDCYEYFYKTTCPAVNKTSLRKEIKKIFPEDRYKKFVRNSLFINETSFLEQIFSLKNEKHRKTKEKVLRILGKRFILKRSPR